MGQSSMFALLLALSTCSASTDTLATYADRCEQHRQAALLDLKTEQKYLEASLHKAKRGYIDPDVTGPVHDSQSTRFPSPQDKKDYLKQCTTRLAEVRAELKQYAEPDIVIMAFLPLEPSVGDSGVLPGEVRVLRVVDSDNMVVHGNIGVERKFEPGSVAGQEWQTSERTVWIEGVPTDGLADDKQTKIPVALQVTGTKKDPSFPSRTIYVLKPLDTSALKFMLLERRRSK